MNTKLFERAKDHVLECKAWSEQKMASNRQHWVEMEACYRGDLVRAYADPFQNRLLSQEWFHKTHSMVETVLTTTISDMPTVDISGRNSPMDDMVADGLNSVMPYYLGKNLFFIELLYWWRNAIKFGFGAMQIDWKFETIRKKIRNEFGERVWMDDIVKYDQPWSKNLDPMRCWPDTSATRVSDMAFFITEDLVSTNYVLDNLKSGKFEAKDRDKVLFGADETSADQDIKTVREMGGVQENPVMRADVLSKVHRKINYWGLFDIDEDGRDEQCLIRLINDEPVQVEENEYGEIPIVDAAYIPVDNDFVGIGLIELTKSLQKIFNKGWNHRIDNEDLILNPMVLVRRGGRVLNSQLRMRPGGRIDVANIDDMKFLDAPIEILNSQVNSHQVHESMWQDVSGVPAVLSGTDTRLSSTPVNRTYSGMAMVQQKAENKLAFYRKIFEVRSLRQLFLRKIDLVSEFQTEPIYMRITDSQFGPQTRQVTPEMIYGAEIDLNVSIRPQEIMNRLVEREKWMSILNQMKMLPGMERRNWDLAIGRWLKAEGVTDYQAILNAPAPQFPPAPPGGVPGENQMAGEGMPSAAPQPSPEEMNSLLAGAMFPQGEGVELAGFPA
jgi:hypothetical protein